MIKQQGEVKIIKLESFPATGLQAATMETDSLGNQIVSHSEKGHHHVVDSDVELLEQIEDVPAGMRVLYAVVEKATALSQTASQAHEAIDLDPGVYSFRIQREYNPFLEEARQVND